MDRLFLPLLLAAFVAYGVVTVVWTFRRGRALLDRWAESNGCEIVESACCWFFRGPFCWSSTQGQVVYQVWVRMPDGSMRQGWARCGGFSFGLFQAKVEVRWGSWRFVLVAGARR